MTGSMYAAVSGLKSHMNALNVIGNNVSNVNTTAYKSTRYTFNEALYTTQRSGSDGTAVAGGRNPAQVGFGASIGTIDLDMSTKNYSPTGQLLDTMIDGDGFFLVGDKVAGADEVSKISLSDSATLKGMNLTRLGNFNVDPKGYLVDGNGSVVWGFVATQAAEYYDKTTGAAANVTVSTENNTTTVTYPEGTTAANYYHLTDMTEDDINALNAARKANELPELTNVQYTEKTEKNTDGSVKMENGKPVYVTDPATGKTVMVVESASIPSTDISAMRVPLIKTTTPQKKESDEENAGYITDTTKKVTTEIVWADPKTLEDIHNAGDVELVRPTGDDDTTTQPARVEYSRVESDSTTIDEKTGALRIMTSDGTLFTVGYIAIAKVTNPNGVTHVDGRYYQAQDGAGVIRVTSVKGAVTGVETSGDTKLITGGLESSGTDLATEISNMITVQRGYQANTRIVTVTDSMLEELVNMKR